jgi:prepilin-type N-terminal cleavage/methylation domain-containing protein
MKKPYLKKNNERGFSLVEFIVVLVIFSIMSGTSLFNFNRYKNNIETTNVAQDIALSIRQAQVYGISATDGFGDGDASAIFGAGGNGNSRDAGVINITQDRSVRGLAIDTESQEIILFEDLDRNNQYESSIDRVIDIRTILTQNIDISVCLFNPGESSASRASLRSCENEVTDGRVNITFQRPYPDAIISYGDFQFGRALIKLKDNSANDLKYIEVNSIGNISVKSYE